MNNSAVVFPFAPLQRQTETAPHPQSRFLIYFNDPHT